MLMLERFNGLGKTESGKLKLVTSSEHAHTHTHNVKPVTRSFCGRGECHLAKGID